MLAFMFVFVFVLGALFLVLFLRPLRLFILRALPLLTCWLGVRGGVCASHPMAIGESYGDT